MGISNIDGSNTVSSTEFSLTNFSTTIATQTTDAIVQAFVDLNAMAAGDQYQLRVYEKLNAGTQRVVYEAVVTGAQSPPIYVFPSLILTDGWDVTAKKLAGTDRTIVSSVRQVT